MILRELLREVMESDDSGVGLSNLEIALKKQMQKAMAGDLESLKFLMERQYGKPKYGMETLRERQPRSREEVFLEMQERRSRFLPRVVDADILESYEVLPDGVVHELKKKIVEDF